MGFSILPQNEVAGLLVQKLTESGVSDVIPPDQYPVFSPDRAAGGMFLILMHLPSRDFIFASRYKCYYV
jgi:hypothetical protein